MPSRWPRAAGHERVERAHAERDALVDARARRAGRAATPGRRASRDRRVADRAEPVDRAARARRACGPSSVVGDLDAERAAARRDARARADPGRVAERHQQRPAGAEADDLGGDRGAPAPGLDRADLADLGLETGRLDDQADQVAHAAVAAVQVGVAQRVDRGLHRGGEHQAAAERGLDDLAGALELGVHARVDVAVRRAHDRAAARDAALGLDHAVLDPAERADEVAHRAAHELEILGMDEHGDALALDQAAQGAADGLQHQRRVDVDAAPRIFSASSSARSTAWASCRAACAATASSCTRARGLPRARRRPAPARPAPPRGPSAGPSACAMRADRRRLGVRRREHRGAPRRLARRCG